MLGYIYCLKNECMPGFLKIGFTDRTVEDRLREANSSGTFGPPSDYTVAFAKLVQEARQKEVILHVLLKKYRKNPKKEFFCAPEEYVKLLFDLVDGEWWDNKNQEVQDENVNTRLLLNEFLNDHIFPALPQSDPITQKLLLETFSNWKEEKNYTFVIKGGVQMLQNLVRDTYGPPSSKGWTQIMIK